MQASQRWGLAAVLGLAIAAIGFVTVQYDKVVIASAVPLVVALAVVIAKPAIAPKVVIGAGAIGLLIAIGYMIWAGMHRDDIADAHAATRAVQTTMAVCGLALMTGRAMLGKSAAKPAPATADATGQPVP